MAVIKKDGNTMALPLSISRGQPIALDATQIWYDKASMEAYAKADPTAYPGQFLSYVNEESKTVEAYIIASVEGTLVKLASTTASGDVSADIIALQNRCTALEGKVETIEKTLEGVSGFDFEVVESLPATGEKGKIYLVAHEHGDKDIYDEYIWTGSTYEKIGNTDVDLTDYYTKTQVDTKISEAISPIQTALDEKQTANANLTAIAALVGDGLVRRKSNNTFELDSASYITATALEPYAKTETVEALTQSVETNTEAISAINNVDTGILAQAKAYADTKTYDDSALKASVEANTSSIGTINTKIGTIETAVEANTNAITAINDASTGILVTAQAYTDNKVAANKTLIDSLTDRVAANETALAEKASTTALDSEILRAKAAEKANADAINLILDNPDTETIDSIKELTKYVEEDGKTTAGLVNRLAGIGGEDEPATVMAAIEASTLKSTKTFGIENNEVSFVSTDLLKQGDNELVFIGGTANG